MILSTRQRRAAVALACLVAVLSGSVPADASPPPDVPAERAIALMNGQSCAVHEYQEYQNAIAQATFPSPSPSPTGFPTPGFGTIPNSTTQLNATPRPQPGSTAPVTPPPIPTSTPNPFDQNVPVFVQRGGSTPPPITPAGQLPPTPTPAPTGVPTLPPNYIAVLADKVNGSTTIGKPGDAEGNVHLLYGAEEIVGDRAHYDGLRTVTITGHPFIINHTRDSVLLADEIRFDTIDQTATLVNGRGTSSQGVDRGLVHFSAKDLHTDADGVGHGLAPTVTTCENARSGYHMTGRNMDVYPGDKIVIYRAILWLGAAAVFFLPKVVIPLRTVDDETQRPKYFPDIGYDQYEGYWIKTRITFGKDQYYYGYYVLNYFTKVGLGLGYVGYFQRRSGHRSGSINFYTINSKLTDSRQNNLAATEIENFSSHLRGNFALNYTSNYGPYTNIPANTSLTGTIVHNTLKTSQNYGFSRSEVGSQASSDTFSFSDTRQFNQAFSNALTFNLSSSQSNYGSVSSSESTGHFNDQLHFTTTGADYLMTIDRNYAQQPYGDNKEPELQIRPYKFLPHFFIPSSATFTIGEYSEPSTPLATQRADLAFVFGPEILKVFGSDFSGTVNVNQFAYGTGDLKAAIQQQFQLISPLGHHFVNTITYNEANYNGPALVPFQYLDTQPQQNTKNAQDLVRIFNGSTYNLSLGFSTLFNAMAQPVSYQLTAQPTARSVVLLSGSFVPGYDDGAGGFGITNLQISTPFGRDATVQFVTNVDWKNHARLEDKVVYYVRTIGNCYQIQVLYNQSQRLVTMSINLLAFPNKGATFNVGQSGPLIPTTFNFNQ